MTHQESNDNDSRFQSVLRTLEADKRAVLRELVQRKDLLRTKAMQDDYHDYIYDVWLEYCELLSTHYDRTTLVQPVSVAEACRFIIVDVDADVFFEG